MANRGRLDIMAHILGLCTKPHLKTRIMYDVGITFSQFQSYAALLESQGLLNKDENRFVTTTKGLQFINAFNQLQGVLDGPRSKIPTPNRLPKARQELKKPPATFYV